MSSADSRTTLETMPIEVLGRLCELSGGWSTFQLSSLSGSRVLRRKLHANHCVRTLSFDLTRPWNQCFEKNTKIVHSNLSIFPSLACLDIRSISHNSPPFKGFALSAVPPTVTSLTLGFDSALELFRQTPSVNSLQALELTSLGSTMVDIGALLPNLREIRLANLATLHNIPRSVFFASFISTLPNTLEHLVFHYRESDSSSSSGPLPMPEAIRTIDICGLQFSLPPNQVLLNLTTLKFSDSELPFKRIEQVPHLSAVRFYTTPSNSCLDTLKTLSSLKSLHLCGVGGASLVKFSESSLETLTVGMITSKFPFASLPRGITHLDLGGLKEAKLEDLPPHLTTLKLDFEKMNREILQWSQLPQSITLLDLTNVTVPFELKQFSCGLSPRLRSLRIIGEEKGKKTFTTTFVNDHLPRSLTTLTLGPRFGFTLDEAGSSDWKRLKIEKFPHLFALSLGSGVENDSALLKLPKQISLLHCSAIPFNGFAIDRNAKHFSSSMMHPSLCQESFSHELRLFTKVLLEKAHRVTDAPMLLVSEDALFFDPLSAFLPVIPSIQFVPTNPTGYPKDLQHITYNLTMPPFEQILWFSTSLTSITTTLPLAIRLPTTLTRLSALHVSHDAISELLSLRYLRAPTARLDLNLPLPQSLTELAVQSVSDKLLQGLKSLRKLKLFSNALQPQTFVSLPPALESFKFRPAIRAPGSGYWESSFQPSSLPPITSAKSLPSMAFTRLDVPRTKFTIIEAAYLPKTLTTLRVGGAQMTEKEFGIICRDLEACGSLQTKVSAGTSKPITKKGIVKALTRLEAARGQNLILVIFEAFLALHCPDIQLSIAILLPPMSESPYLSLTSSTLTTKEFAAKLPRQLKSLVYGAFPRSSVKPLKMRSVQGSGAEIFKLSSRFAKSLPPTLTILHVSSAHHAMDMHVGAFLPPTLTHLSVNARLWNHKSILLLPTGLQTLEIRFARKWNQRWSEALQRFPSLAVLRVDCHGVHGKLIGKLPLTLRRFTLISASLTPSCMRYLPSSLESFTFSDYSRKMRAENILAWFNASPSHKQDLPNLQHLNLLHLYHGYREARLTRLDHLLSATPDNNLDIYESEGLDYGLEFDEPPF